MSPDYCVPSRIPRDGSCFRGRSSPRTKRRACSNRFLRRRLLCRGNRQRPRKWRSARCFISNHESPKATNIAAARATILEWAAADGRSSSVGHQWQLSGRKTLSVLNAVFNKSQYFDGRASDLKDQVVRSVMAFPAALLRTRGGPTIFNPAEMNIRNSMPSNSLKPYPAMSKPSKRAFPT